MRKIRGKQRILAVLLCAGLALQGMPLEAFATEVDRETEAVEYSLEQETENSEVEIRTEINTEQETETEEQENYSETGQIFQTETNSGEEEKTTGVGEVETDVESEIEEETIEELENNQEVLSGKCGDNLTWKIENGTLNISGTGDMWDYDPMDNPPLWAEYCSKNNVKLHIENGITSIGESAFGRYILSDYTGFIGNLVIPDSVISIGDRAFDQCFGFSGCLIIPNSVTSIGSYAFSGCSGFTGSLEIPNSVINIGEAAFWECSGLSGNLIIPNSITYIEYATFSDCSGFNGNLIIPNSVTGIGTGAFADCSGFNGNLIIPNSVTGIGTGAFADCSGFNGNLIIPNSVTEIGSFAFSGCSGFSGNLKIPNSVTYMGEAAFCECRGLVGEIIIPKSVKKVYEYAFENCINLRDIYITETLNKIVDNPFQEIEYDENYGDYGGYDPSTARNLNITFHCPKNSYAYNWALQNGFKVVEWDGGSIGGDTPPDDDTSGKCGNNLTWKLKDDKDYYTLTISGTGDMYDYALEKNISTAPYIEHIKSKTVVLKIEEGVTSIGKYAFYDCENINGNVIIPSSVTTIEDSAFYNCTGITDIYMRDTLTQIGKNPFQYFNALIGTFKNMELTLHCMKDSYAYKWAKDNGFTVEEWDGITIDIRKSGITINGRGYAYARFLLKDNNGQVQKNTTISYSFGGKSYTATSDKDGYVQIKSELISDNKETKKQIKTTQIILDPNGKKEKLNNRIVMVVKVTPFTYTQTWKVGMGGSVTAGGAAEISAEGGDAEAKASLGETCITGSKKGTVALEIEHSGDRQNVKLEQNFNGRVGLKANGGAETKAIALGKGIDIDGLSASGSASVGIGQGIGLQIDNYNPGSFNDNLNVGKFAIAMIGSQTGNGMLIRLVDLMGVDLYNMSDKSVGFYAKAGANVGKVTYGGKELGTIKGVESSISYTYTSKKNELNKTLGHKMELESSATQNSEVKIPLTDKLSMAENILSQEYLNAYAVELTEDYNHVAKKLKINLKTADEKTQFIKDKKNTKNLSVEFDAVDTQKLEQDILSLHQLKLGNLPFITMIAARENLFTQIDKAGVNGTYNCSSSTSVGDSKDFSLGGSLGAKLKLGMEIEGIYNLKYNTESGTYQNGSIIKTSEVSDISDLVSGTQWNDFTDFFTDPVEIALNNAKNFIVDIGEAFVDGVVDTYVTLKTTVEDGVGVIEKWVLHVVKIDGGNEKQRVFNSYGIMSVNAAPNGDMVTEKVVFTVSDPYYVYVTDEKEQTINDFEKYPLELTLKYTDEMLEAASIGVNDVENISIYQYSEELCGYVCIGGTVDSKNQEVKTEITEAGQYLLAVDTSAPVVADVSISGDTNKPLITVYFDEISGLKEVSFKLDGEKVVNASNWKVYYNAASSCISYQVTNELANGVHTVSIYAVDSAGNAMSEPFTFEFYIEGNDENPSNPEPDYGDILPEDIPTDGVIPKGLWISNVEPQNYTGKAIKPQIRVYDYKNLLTEKKDYTISYKNNINASGAKTAKTAPTITVTGKGNYTGKETAVFEILPIDISDEGIEIEDITLPYNKKVQKPTPVILWNGKKLKPTSDFQVQYTDKSAQAYQGIGSYKIVVTGKGNFSGQRDLEVSITNNKLIAKTKVDKIANQPYTGKEVKPKITIKQGKTPLKEGKDYTLAYRNNIEVGKASVTISGIGEYSGKKTIYFNISGGSIAKAVITGLSKTAAYTGSEITQSCTLTIALNGSTKTLKKGTDYTVSYVNNIRAGKATVIFKGINGFSGVLKQSFTITPFDIGSPSDSKFKITMPKTVPYAKGGSAPKPEITFDGKTLCEGTDYTLSYKNNKDITANGKSVKNPQVTVKGKGNFKGARSLDFQISVQDISKLTLNAADQMYQSKRNVYGTKVEIVDLDRKKLSAGKDYDKNLTYTYAANTTLSDGILRKAGEAVQKNDLIPAGTNIQVSAAGKGSYTGTISGEYRIAKADIGKASVKVASQIYTGGAVELDKSAIEVKINGKKLADDYYEIVKYDNNVNKGSAAVTIKGVGDCGGVKTVKFTIRSKGFLWWWRK